MYLIVIAKYLQNYINKIKQTFDNSFNFFFANLQNLKFELRKLCYKKLRYTNVCPEILTMSIRFKNRKTSYNLFVTLQPLLSTSVTTTSFSFYYQNFFVITTSLRWLSTLFQSLNFQINTHKIRYVWVYLNGIYL